MRGSPAGCSMQGSWKGSGHRGSGAPLPACDRSRSSGRRACWRARARDLRRSCPWGSTGASHRGACWPRRRPSPRATSTRPSARRSRCRSGRRRRRAHRTRPRPWPSRAWSDRCGCRRGRRAACGRASRAPRRPAPAGRRDPLPHSSPRWCGRAARRGAVPPAPGRMNGGGEHRRRGVRRARSSRASSSVPSSRTRRAAARGRCARRRSAPARAGHAHRASSPPQASCRRFRAA